MPLVLRGQTCLRSTTRALSCTRLATAGLASVSGKDTSAERESYKYSTTSCKPGDLSWGPAQEDQEGLCREVLRCSMVAESAAAGLFRGQQFVLGGSRPDVRTFWEREQQHLQRLQELAPQHRTRPSLLSPLVSTGFFALGAAAAVLSKNISAAVAGGLQEALTEAYNDNLRQMQDAGVSAVQVREAVKSVRDEDRAIEGGPKVPDVTLLLQKDHWRNVSIEESIAAITKVGTATLVSASRKL